MNLSAEHDESNTAMISINGAKNDSFFFILRMNTSKFLAKILKVRIIHG